MQFGPQWNGTQFKPTIMFGIESLSRRSIYRSSGIGKSCSCSCGVTVGNYNAFFRQPNESLPQHPAWRRAARAGACTNHSSSRALFFIPDARQISKDRIVAYNMGKQGTTQTTLFSARVCCIGECSPQIRHVSLLHFVCRARTRTGPIGC